MTYIISHIITINNNRALNTGPCAKSPSSSYQSSSPTHQSPSESSYTKTPHPCLWIVSPFTISNWLIIRPADHVRFFTIWSWLVCLFFIWIRSSICRRSSLWGRGEVGPWVVRVRYGCLSNMCFPSFYKLKWIFLLLTGFSY